MYSFAFTMPVRVTLAIIQIDIGQYANIETQFKLFRIFNTLSSGEFSLKFKVKTLKLL